jgi:hypothetical protein
MIRGSEVRVGRANDIWLWLAGFRVFVDNVKRDKNLIINQDYSQYSTKQNSGGFKESSILKSINSRFLNKSESINLLTKDVRSYYRSYQTEKLKEQFTTKYPVKKMDISLFDQK